MPLVYVTGVVHLVAVVYIIDKLNVDEAGEAEIMTDAKTIRRLRLCRLQQGRALAVLLVALVVPPWASG